MTKYLFEDLSGPDTVQAIVDEAQVIEAIDDAHKAQKKIRVHIVGPCLLDWTKTAPEGRPELPAPPEASVNTG